MLDLEFDSKPPVQLESVWDYPMSHPDLDRMAAPDAESTEAAHKQLQAEWSKAQALPMPS